MKHWSAILRVILIAAGLGSFLGASGAVTVFFDATQTTNLVVSGATSDTISSEGYLFTFTRDKLFTGGVGLTNPIGRTVRVPWPSGLEAQAVTAGPATEKARITIQRQDGGLFTIQSFTARLLANTAGAGAAFEIMPLINGEDGVPEPFMFNATGIAGNQFSYSTPALTNFDEFKITLYVDYALMNLTVVDSLPPRPTIEVRSLDATHVQLSWPADSAGYLLESSDRLPAATWAPVTNTVMTNIDFLSVVAETAGNQRFFRLRR